MMTRSGTTNPYKKELQRKRFNNFDAPVLSAIHSMKVTVAPMFDRYVGAMTIN